MKRMPSFSRGKKKEKAAENMASGLVVRDASVPAPENEVEALLQRKAEADARAQMEAEELSEMLPLRKPKSVIDGTTSGLKLAVGGVVGGAVGLVAMPAIGTYEGAKKSGAKGAAKGFVGGLAKGVAGAVVLPLVGGISGTGQVLRGVVQTPYAISGTASGKQYDKDARVWRHYSLTEEVEEVKSTEEEWTKKLAARREALKAAAGKSGGVEDTSLYEQLCVEPDASQHDIKRAYMKLAMKMHPDKNRDDPLATDKFQKLGEAYQVLSNEDSRARYDAKGMDGLDDQKFMDPSTMYAMLFGSEKFDDLIGELQIASILQQASEGAGDEPSLKHMTFKQRQREVDCARKLAERLQPFADESVDQAAFEADATAACAELATTAFGELLTHTIGRIYFFKASQALKLSGHTWGTNANALKAMVRMYKVSKKAQGLEESEQAKAIQGDMATFLEGAWYVSVVDVESTLHHVCKKVLTDTSIPKAQRKRRAIALRRLGEIYLGAISDESKSADGKVKTLRERLQEMMPVPEDMAAAVPDEGDDDDDFPDLDGADTPRADASNGASSSATEAAPAAEPPSREVLTAMSVKELKAVMLAQSLSHEGLLEKSEYVDAIVAAYESAATAAELGSGSPTRV